MEGIKATYINEIERMLKRKKAILTLVLSLIVIIGGQLVFSALRNGLDLRIVNSSEFSLSVLYVLSTIILPLFSTLLTIDIFAGEFSQNTMKLTIYRPVSRFGIYLAKILAVLTFIVANLVIVMVLSTLIGLIFNPSDFNIGNLLKILLSYFVTFYPVLILTLFIALISNILKSGTAIFFLTILLYFGLQVLSIVFSNFSGVFIVSQLSWYSRFIYDTVAWGSILRQFLILTGYGIVFFTAGFYIFDKRDL
jgi:ABC-2 type transport system permease protein